MRNFVAGALVPVFVDVLFVTRDEKGTRCAAPQLRGLSGGARRWRDRLSTRQHRNPGDKKVARALFAITGEHHQPHHGPTRHFSGRDTSAD